MARKPIEQQIAQLEARAKTLKARLARQDRARDTRRKSSSAPSSSTASNTTAMPNSLSASPTGSDANSPASSPARKIRLYSPICLTTKPMQPLRSPHLRKPTRDIAQWRSVLASGNSSPSSGGTSGASSRMRKAAATSARAARFCKSRKPRRWPSPSAIKATRSWLMETCSSAAAALA